MNSHQTYVHRHINYVTPFKKLKCFQFQYHSILKLNFLCSLSFSFQLSLITNTWKHVYNQIDSFFKERQTHAYIHVRIKRTRIPSIFCQFCHKIKNIDFLCNLSHEWIEFWALYIRKIWKIISRAKLHLVWMLTKHLDQENDT